MSKTAMIRARTDARLKEQVERIFERPGLNTTSAINIFYKHVLMAKGIPLRREDPERCDAPSYEGRRGRSHRQRLQEYGRALPQLE